MVTKAIERAQNTVEGRNAEIRKDVLKYDEVLDKQRKVIYERRIQVIDGEDLREPTEQHAGADHRRLVASTCPTEYPEDWDLEQLLQEVTQYFPTAVHGRGARRGNDQGAAEREPSRRGHGAVPGARRAVPGREPIRHARSSARSCSR